MSELCVVKYQKINGDGFDLVKESPSSAGFLLKSSEDYVIGSHTKCLCKTGLRIQLPANCYGKIAPLAGLAYDYFIDVGAGVVDEDFRGEVMVLLFNFGDTTCTVRKGDDIAQLICKKICYPGLQLVEDLGVADDEKE